MDLDLVIAIQFHQADRAKADRLARLIHDIEPRKRTDVEIYFVHRYDCEQLDRDTTELVAKKFLVSGFKTKTQWDGWPAGCNGVAKDTLWSLMPLWDKIEGVLMIEPDTIPVKAGWIDQLIAEWRVARAQGNAIMGAWRDSGPPGGHINGNCVIDLGASERAGINSIHQHLAWDCHVSTALRGKWHRTGLIKNCFQSHNATTEAIRTPDEGNRQPCLIHGYKDDSVYEYARRTLL